MGRRMRGLRTRAHSMVGGAIAPYLSINAKYYNYGCTVINSVLRLLLRAFRSIAPPRRATAFPLYVARSPSPRSPYLPRRGAW